MERDYTFGCLDFGPGRGSLRIRRGDSDRLVLQAVRDEFAESAVLCSFPFTVDDALSIFRGGSFQISTPDGHFMARLSGENVWIVCHVNWADFAESALVPVAAYRAAMGAGPKVQRDPRQSFWMA